MDFFFFSFEGFFPSFLILDLDCIVLALYMLSLRSMGVVFENNMRDKIKESDGERLMVYLLIYYVLR